MQRDVPCLLRCVAYRQRGIANLERPIDGMQRGIPYLLRRVAYRQRLIAYHQWLIDGLKRNIDGMENVLK